MRTIKLTLEYDGSEFSGWQFQPDRRTVQGEVEKALGSLTREAIRVVGAGRTDAGVHALGQVASFRTDSSLTLSVFEKGLNGLLPRDVRVLRAEEMDGPFDARRDAVGRTYRYVLSRRGKAVGRQYTWCPGVRFSVERMEEAAGWLVGERVFASFSKDDGEGGDFLSRVFRVVWETTDEEVRFEIAAERFFHNMVRIIVGTLLEVGRGKMSPERFREIMDAGDRRLAGPTVPPQGLFLVRVDYG